MFKRIAAIQLLAGGAFLSTFTYIALKGDEMGLSGGEIAIMASLFAISQFFSSYLFGRLADRFGKRPVLIIGLLFLSLSLIAVTAGKDIYSLTVFRAVSGVGFGMYPGALAAYAFDSRVGMGRFSAFQALGWGISLLISGPVADLFGVDGVFYMAALFVGAGFAVALSLGSIPEVRMVTPLIPFGMILKNREVLIPLIVRHATANSIWVLWPIFLREEIGLSFVQVGMVLATNSFTQFFAMFFLGDRIEPKKAIGLGLLFSSMAALSFILVGSFPLFLVTQLLLGLSWSNLFVGSLRSMLNKNRERASAAGLLKSSTSFSGLIGPVLALGMVELFPMIPYKGPMLLCALASFVAFLYYLKRGMHRVPVSRRGKDGSQ